MLTNNVADFLAWEKIPSHLRSSLGTQALEDLAKLPEDWPEVEYLSAAGCKWRFLVASLSKLNSSNTPKRS